MKISKFTSSTHLNSNNQRLIISMFIAVLLYCFIWSTNFNSQWNISDDHEIFSFVGPDSVLKLNEIGTVLSKTEIFSPGETLRYRPAFILGKVLETFVWGLNPFLWFFARAIIYCFFVSVLGYCILKIFGNLWGSAITLYLLSRFYWADIMTRLSGSETYALFGIGFILIGLNFLSDIKIKNKTQNIIINGLIFLGFFISAGSKENFVLLFIPISYFYLKLYCEKNLSNVSKIGFLLITIFTVFVSMAIVSALYKSGHDVYMTTVSPIQRILNLFNSTLSSFPIILNLIVFISSLILFFFFFKRSRLSSPVQSKFIAHQSIILILNLGNFFFYNGKWPQGIRYDFPSMILIYFSLFYLVKYFLNHYKHVSLIKILKLCTPLILLGIALHSFSGIVKLRENALEVTSYTQSFTSRMRKIEEKIKSMQYPQVFVINDNPGDIEIVHTFSSFMHGLGVPAEFFLKNKFELNGTEAPLIKYLGEELLKTESEGLAYYNESNEHVEKIDSPCVYIREPAKKPNCNFIGFVVN